MIEEHNVETDFYEKRRALLKTLLEEQGANGKIARRQEQGPAPLAFAQERLWFLDQYYPGSPLYNIPVTLPLFGQLNVEVARASLNEIVRRHEALRTSFIVEDGMPLQVVAPKLELEIPLIDLTNLPEDERQAAAAKLLNEEGVRTFDLSTGPLLRATLLRLWDQVHILALTMHHIVSDAWSMGVFTNEFNALYGAFLQGQPSPLPELSIQYPDFAIWQRRMLQGDGLNTQLAYWREHLAGVPEAIELLTDHPRPLTLTFKGATINFLLSTRVSERIRALTQEAGVTPFITLLACFKALIFRYTGNQSIVVGIPTANRNRTEIEGLIGFFVNTLVLRTKISPDLSFRQLLARVREVTLGAYAHQDLPFEKLVEDLQPTRSANINPLFQMMFDFQLQSPMGAAPQPPTTAHHAPGQPDGNGAGAADDGGIISAMSGTSKFDLSLIMMEAGRQFGGSFEYSTELFDEATVVRIVGHFQTLVGALVEDPGLPIGKLPLMPEAEKRLVLAEWNNTKTPFAEHLCAHEQFEAQAAQTPDAVAAIFEQQELSYRDLNRRANRLARSLRASGVGPETVVGICMEGSLEMLVAIFGVLKAGGAYLPLDPAYPRGRLAFMIEDAKVRLVLMQEHLRESLKGLGEAALMALDVEEKQLGELNDENLPVNTSPRNACYVIYTSGSTGRPKGIIIEHRSLVNLVMALGKVFGIGAGRRVLQFASFSFDQSVREVFETLLSGATLCLARREEMMPGQPLLKVLREKQITDVTLVPSIQTYLPDADLPDLRTIMAGGEICPETLVNRWGRDRMFVNAYGPSETTFASSMTHWLPNAGKPTIGRPLSNVQCYVVDEQLQPCVAGIEGELLIGGVGLARGYLGRPDLTAERFIPDPFGGEAGARLYRTGDLARWLPNGELDYIGRIDQQVKVRGFRIELGEIESVLMEHEGVSGATVTCQGEASDEQLVAYLVSSDGRERGEEIRQYLSTRLPEYMVPQLIVYLEGLPLTAAGKVDRRALPSLEEVRGRKGYVGPKTEAERVMAGIWGEVFGVERVGVHDNFFELGGHSLLVTQIVSRVRDTLHVEMPIRKVFETPTIAELALWLEHEAGLDEKLLTADRVSMPLDDLDEKSRPPLSSVEVSHASVAEPEQLKRAESGAADNSTNRSTLDRIYQRQQSRTAPLSLTQERLWILDQIQPGNTAYNVFRPLPFAGQVNVAALERSLNELVNRHETLRTTFQIEDGPPVQVIAPSLQVNLIYKDLSNLPAAEKQSQAGAIVQEEALRPFDLARGPLLRAILLSLGREEHLLALCMHHIIADEWSIKIFLRDLMALYEADCSGQPAALPALPIQYADFAIWQRERMQGEVLEEHLSFWREQLMDAPTVLELPLDHPRPAVESFRGAMEPFAFSPQLSEALEKIGRQENATTFMTLLAAYMALLHRYTGEQKIVVGAPIANRNRAEIENLIGFFTNTLVLHANLNDDPTFRQLLRQVREMTLGAYAHSDMPFERLVEELNPARNLNINPLFQVMFVLQKAAGVFQAQQDKGSQPDKISGESVTTAKFDLTLYMDETEQGLLGGVEYATEIFERDTIRRMIAHFENLLMGVSSHPDRPLSQVNLLPVAEHLQLLKEWAVSSEPSIGVRCIHELVEAQVERTPDAVALVAGERNITYRELNESANRLARHLRQLGVGAEVCVGILMERGAELMTALLGVMKAGAVYLPLNPSLPKERLEFIIKDARVQILLVQQSVNGWLTNTATHVLQFDEAMKLAEEQSAENPIAETYSESPAYVIYTSGSTGVPKGVVLPHRTLTGLIMWQLSHPELSGARRTLQYSSPSFDVSLQEVFATWCSGGTLVCIDEETHRDFNQLVRLLTDERIERLFLPYVALQQLAEAALSSDASYSLREVITAGEQLKVSPAISAFFRRLKHCRLYNQYGPSETHVVSEYRLADKTEEWGRLPPIGSPVAGFRVYVLDRWRQPVPTGVVGELYIGGEGLARGYLNQPDKTAEKFLPDSFSEIPGARMYRTGDLVRHRADGLLEFVDRIDQQLKIRGFRVEPGEIESCLVRHPSVAEAVVAARTLGDTTQLVGFVVPSGNDEEPTSQNLRAFLRETLPDYMIPAQLIIMDELPLTGTGKLDRQRLSEFDYSRAEINESSVAPRSSLEQQIAVIWTEVLGVANPGINDNFFELGGHSLLATQLISRLRSQFSIEIPVRHIFQEPTIAGLALTVVQLHAEQASEEDLAAILRDLEQLSVEDVEAQP